MFLGDDGKLILAREIGAFEARTAAELVIVVEPRAGHYLHVPLAFAGLAALAALAFLLYGEPSFALHWFLIDPVLLGLLVGWLTSGWAPLERLVTPAARRQAWVLRAARAAFVARGVADTRDRTGLLLYIAVGERSAVVLPDLGLRRGGLDNLRTRDPEFSPVLFEDFLYALYARAQEARSDPALMAKLAPYIAESTRAALLAREPEGAAISAVVIGAMRIVNLKTTEARTRVELEFEANYSADTGHGDQGYYVMERWTVERAADVLTKPRDPAQAQEFRCPNCGAPFESTGDDRCSYCRQEVGEGRFDWTLTHVRLVQQETRPPALTADVAELGTDLPTVFDPQIQANHAALVAEDPGAAPELIERRMRAIYTQLNAAWTALELRPIRPLVSDSMFNYLQYWIAAYRKQGLRNVLERMSIERVQIVKLTRDRHYDAITLRFWASGLDYTVRTADRTRVSGSDKRPRAYSEYWTLIRGASVRGAPREPGTCPSCGAPTDRVNMAGTCEYCGAHLTRGEFDWVLSKIEQDDSYAG